VYSVLREKILKKSLNPPCSKHQWIPYSALGEKILKYACVTKHVKSCKATVRIWDNLGVIPEFDQFFEINSKKFNYLSGFGHFEHRRIDYPYAWHHPPQTSLCLLIPLRSYLSLIVITFDRSEYWNKFKEI